MALSVDIDGQSGFCGGVIRAIGKAEEILDQSDRLYSLGAIVHNEMELARLGDKGLMVINKLSELEPGDKASVLIRAHGEPPKTYADAAQMHLNLIDATCPVVLNLQKKIRDTYHRQQAEGEGQILIFGKIGHAEVLGLVGQTEGTAIVVQDIAMLKEAIASGALCLDKPIEVFSQTTKSPVEYEALCDTLRSLVAATSGSVAGPRAEELVTVHNTICVQVATRHERLVAFASCHDVIIFVAGKDSSNGKVLCELCRENNFRTYHITSTEDISDNWFRPDDKVGVCGATSTPKWLLEEVAHKILQKNN